jgi:hypothetical protein
MGVYDRQIETAKRLIARYGQQCQWYKDTIVLDDPTRPYLGGGTTSVIKTPSIAFIPATDGASGFGISKFNDAQGTIDFSTFGLMGVQDFVPLTTDRVLRAGVPLVIKSVDVLAPNEQTVLYILSIV